MVTALNINKTDNVCMMWHRGAFMLTTVAMEKQ